MKFGFENKTKTILAAVLAIFATLMIVRAFSGGDEGSAPAANVPKPVTGSAATTAHKSGSQNTRKGGPLLAQTLDPTLRFDLLKSSEDISYKGSGRDIFRSQSEPAPIPKALPPDQQPNAGPPPPPPPPPINLKFYGFASSKDGNKRIFLSQGEDIFVAKEGQVIDRRYRIVKINANSVDVEDVLTNNRQTLPLNAG